MKKIATLLLVSASFLLTGCLDTLDELVINADGTGTYRQTINMDKMFDMMEMAAAMDTAAERQMKEMDKQSIDTTYSLASKADDPKLTADEKRLMNNAKMSMVMSKKDSKFRIASEYPFTKMDDIVRIYALQGSGKAMGGEGIPGLGKAMDELGDEGLPGTNKTYDITATNGLIERKINQKNFDELMKSESMKEMEQAKPMLEAITFRSKITLPRPAKKVTGEKAELSADKKTVTINATLVDMLEKPKSLEYRIEY